MNFYRQNLTLQTTNTYNPGALVGLSEKDGVVRALHVSHFVGHVLYKNATLRPETESPKTLSPDQNRFRKKYMARIVMLQFCAALILAIIALLLGGQAAGISALLGGLCCALPNALFALRLYAGTHRPGGANPLTFFTGEFLKIFITVALLAAVVKLYHDVHWLAFLAGFIVVLKSYFILLFRS